jgi:thiamine biosynthesis lipoprotein
MDRRDFLRSRHLASTAGQVLGALDEMQGLAVEEAPPQETAFLRLSRRAMATSFEILLPFDTPHAAEMGEAAFELIDALEAQLTVYRDDSEVSRINQLAPSRPVPVEARLFDLLSLAQRISAETEGAFDVTAGALIKAWGFFRGPKRVPGEEQLRRAMERVGMRWVTLAPEGRSVRFGRRGLEINLGAIGKGYALDRAAELLGRQWNLSAALLHGGYSSVYAKGSPPGDERGWPVGITRPWERTRRLALVYLRDRALGNSAATFQHLEHQGRKLGHVLDPRSGWPASGIDSASVLAPTAAEADALSTACYVGGVELARRYCAERPAVGAVLLPEGAAEPVVLNLAPHEITLTP